MSTYVEMRTDSFSRNLEDVASGRYLDFNNVRRPMRGIEIKDDTYAIIKVIRSNGREIPLVDAGSRISAPTATTAGGAGADPVYGRGLLHYPDEGTTFNFSNFIAQRITDARQEKSQIVENFGEPYIFFYGEKPRILNIQGLLMNTLDFNWKNEFWRNYERYFRGTKLVELDARVYFYFDDQIVEGYVLEAQAVHESSLPYHVPFNLTIFVTAHTYLGTLDSTGMYPVSANVQIPADNLRDIQNVNETIRQLRQRADDLRPDELVSTVVDVRIAAFNAANGIVGKDAIVGAIIRGLSDFDAKVEAFYSNVKTYFYGRRTVVPAGIAGAEEYVGPEVHAGNAIAIGEPPNRTLPIRSAIADNYDEYIGGGGPPLPQNAMEELAKAAEVSPEFYESMLLVELASYGVDITDPTPLNNWRSTLTHSLTKTADSLDYIAGTARGLGNLKTKGEQMYQTLKGVGRMTVETLGYLKSNVPVPIP